MAWLHTWVGLWFSWLLFAVFLTGTLASLDGLRFAKVSSTPFNSVRLSGRRSGVLVGPKGSIGAWKA
jgi:photosystem II stability/assembly factor-like uncharacterized protein